jgi:hypothetical protein
MFDFILIRDSSVDRKRKENGGLDSESSKKPRADTAVVDDEEEGEIKEDSTTVTKVDHSKGSIVSGSVNGDKELV